MVKPDVDLEEPWCGLEVGALAPLCASLIAQGGVKGSAGQRRGANPPSTQGFLLSSPYCVHAAIHMDDLASGLWEPIREESYRALCCRHWIRNIPVQRGSGVPDLFKLCETWYRLAAIVLIGPAAIKFTRIFSLPRSRARYRVADSSAAFATPIQSYCGQATVASKSIPTTEPPELIKSLVAIVKEASEYAETWRAIATSSQEV